MHAYISSRLFYYNSLYAIHGLPQYSSKKCPYVQNCVALNHDNVSHVLKKFHWVSVKYRISFLEIMNGQPHLISQTDGFILQYQYMPEWHVRSENIEGCLMTYDIKWYDTERSIKPWCFIPLEWHPIKYV